MAPDVLETKRNFQSLSVKDLIEARDLYHYHLLHKANVVGTAVGLYLIRDGDPWPSSDRNHGTTTAKRTVKPKAAQKGERRFDNSSVRDYSWPCVLVMVKEWMPESAFGGRKLHAQDMVPKTLYMPDGRSVPVCVVKVTPGEERRDSLPHWHWPESLIGGGLPVLINAQQQEKVASIGCLVTDGHTTYALTNRHVCGAEGEEVYSIRRGQKVRIGRASDKQLTRMPFSEVYPDFVVRRTYLNLDIGLIDVDDASDWTSQVYGLGEIGQLADLSEQNITLRLIGAKLVAHGAASGDLKGTIKALFYRYKSVGGYDYVSDFLIAPEDNSQQTRTGDSGTVWHLETDKDHPLPRPLCIEWGGQVFLDGLDRKQFQFALATGLSNVCKLLDVELVQAHNTGVQPYWGQMGHYSIGAFACNAIRNAKLRGFFQKNVDRISFELGELTPKKIKELLKDARENNGFVPLADVPDVVWKQMPQTIEGGRDVRRAGHSTTGPEHPTHYADVDQPDDSGKTLLQLCLDDPANLDVDVWRAFYDRQGHTQQRDRGLLPFRVWQFFDEMKTAAEHGNVNRYLCAAGLLAHYVGDACQPLHGSILADGYKDRPSTQTVQHRDGTTEEVSSNLGAGVHSAYETAMIDRKQDPLRTGIPAKLNQLANLPFVASGKEAAQAIIDLMDRSARKVPPKKLVDAFVKAGGTKTVAVYDKLWDKFGDGTIAIMADGARVLAMIWESAWRAGNGNQIPESKLKALRKDTLAGLYRDPNFVPSLDLDHIKPSLT